MKRNHRRRQWQGGGGVGAALKIARLIQQAVKLGRVVTKIGSKSKHLLRGRKALTSAAKKEDPRDLLLEILDVLGAGSNDLIPSDLIKTLVDQKKGRKKKKDKERKQWAEGGSIRARLNSNDARRGRKKKATATNWFERHKIHDRLLLSRLYPGSERELDILLRRR